jgi:hypothetical protein
MKIQKIRKFKPKEFKDKLKIPTEKIPELKIHEKF